MSRIDRKGTEGARQTWEAQSDVAPRQTEKKKSGGFFGFLGRLFDFGPSEPAVPALLRNLRNTNNPVLIRGATSTRAVDASTTKLSVDEAGPPEKAALAQLREHDEPTVALAKSKKGAAYGLVLPKNFDTKSNDDYRIRTVTTPPGVSVSDVISTLAKNPPNLDNTIIVIADEQRPASAAASGILEELLPDFPIDFATHESQKLNGDAGAWGAAIASGEKSRPARLLGPMISTPRGGWSQFPPTTSHELRFPGSGTVESSQTIPAAMQKQSATRGTFFAPILKSDALKSSVRTGVYLPPGYDPDSKEKLPVLFMLPGKSNPLSHWTSVGQLIGKLDNMMQGAAQKMIVVIPDGNDSYFVNDDPKAEDSRRYQDFVVDELVAYATKTLKGDVDKLSLAGISRGGYGALCAAAENPGVFQSVSSHSGSLGAQRNPGTPHNPTLLARKGAFDENMPRMLVDIGANDQYFVDETIDFAAILDKRGVQLETRILEAPTAEGDTPLDRHNWNFWTNVIESWIGFAQETYGQPGTPKTTAAFTDDAGERINERLHESEAAWDALAAKAQRASTSATRTQDAVDGLTKRVGNDKRLAKLIGLGELQRTAKSAAEAAEELAAMPESRAGQLFDAVQSDAARRLESKVASASQTVVRATDEVDQWMAMPKDVRSNLLSAIDKAPGIKASVLQIARMRPGLFERADVVTNERFDKQIADHVARLDKEEIPGFSQLLTRMAVGQNRWKVGGWSHSVCATLTTWMTHPGLVLKMIEAAKDRKDFPLHHVYDGNGPSSLRPTEDLAKAYQVLRAPKEGGFYTKDPDVLAGGQMRYERGLLKAIVDVINPDRLVDKRYAKTCDPVALGMHRLTGIETRYHYAYNMKDGADFAKALESQGPYGLAMADVEFAVDGKDFQFSHFPTFYDYDKETNTVTWQDFSKRPAERISLDNLRFPPTGSKRPAIYYRPNETINAFLTLHEQTSPAKPTPSLDLRWGEKED